MGSITRTFTNNIGASGVLSANAINNSSLSNITSISGVNLKLLTTTTASSDSSISFTSGIDSTYKEYWFIFNNIHPATDGADFQFQASTNGGSSYGIAVQSTFFGASQSEGGAGGQVSYTTSMDQALSTGYQAISPDVGNDNDQCVSGFLKFFNPSDTTYTKFFSGRSYRVDAGDYAVDCHVSGYFNTTSAINAIQFKFDSGNIDAGTIKLYGVS